jgi:hypothetical protein
MTYVFNVANADYLPRKFLSKVDTKNYSIRYSSSKF